jgi:hypothetical protein
VEQLYWREVVGGGAVSGGVALPACLLRLSFSCAWLLAFKCLTYLVPHDVR